MRTPACSACTRRAAPAARAPSCTGHTWCTRPHRPARPPAGAAATPWHLQEFLGEPNGPLAHELLHTTYTDRSRSSLPAYGTWERQQEPVHPRLQQELSHH